MMQSLRMALIKAGVAGIRRVSVKAALGQSAKRIPIVGEISIEISRSGGKPRYATLAWSSVRGTNPTPREGPMELVPVLERHGAVTGEEHLCPYPVSNRKHRLIWIDKVGPYRVPVQVVNDVLFAGSEGPAMVTLGGVVHWVRAIDEVVVRNAQRAAAHVKVARRGRKGSR